MAEENRARNNPRIHRIWTHMIERCEKTSHHSYERYGGRGITVCEKWRNDFTEFCKWSKENGYSNLLTIDRIDNSKGYSPENCRWVDMKTQCRNRRTNRVVEFRGESLTIAEWAERTGMHPSTIRKRLDIGWSIEKTLTTPIREEKGA